MRFKPDGRWLWIWGIVVFSVLYGHFAKSHHLFPSPQIEAAGDYFRDLKSKASGKLRWYYERAASPRQVIVRDAGRMAPGLTLVNGLGPKGAFFARLIDAQGKVLHAWDLDWYRIWPDGAGVASERRPKERPGTLVHGMVLAPNGDLTFNYERLGMVQLDVCGRVKWRLARNANHSLELDDAGNFWTQEDEDWKTPLKGLPNYAPNFDNFIIMQVSPTGRMMREIPIFDLLQRNNLQGLLYLSSIENQSTVVTGDTLHVNDVEVFSKRMKSDLFKPGDIMISLRNINAILVFDPATLVVKAITVGHFVRQHDPDFLDGSTISLLDNNNVGTDPAHGSSRIVEYSFKTGRQRILFEGNAAHPFYTDFLGKQQRLSNGDLLITEATHGRAFEATPDGQVIWEYRNVIGPNLVGLLTEAQRIPMDTLSPDKLRQLSATCHQ